jgi:hypothetical protein
MRANPFIDKIYETLSGKESEKVPENIRNIRLATCKNCITEDGKKMVLPTGNCRTCGCFVNLKTEYADESCPLGKW